MCRAASIEVLSLNGLGAAGGCKNTVQFPFTGVSLFNTIGGTLPGCVWHLPNLTTLHLTGNGLTGDLISRLPSHSRLADLSLSHNKFSGTIPLHIQKVRAVDLSRNQFSGRYEDYEELWTTTSVNVEINRLSGQLPMSKLENVSDLNMLRGNMFSCDTIPSNDDYVDDYVCGSEDLNEALKVFAAALSFASLIAVAVCLSASTARWPTSFQSCPQRHLTRLYMYMTCHDQQHSADESLQAIAALCDKFKKTAWLFLQLLFVMMAIGAPIYIMRGRDGDNTLSTHTNTYSWFWTLAYLRGVVPSSSILIAWVVTLTFSFYCIILVPLIKGTPAKTEPLVQKSGNENTMSQGDTC
jgi:hypothetical protein